MKTREWSNLIVFTFKSTLFGHTLRKKSGTFNFWPRLLFLVHIWFTPSEGSTIFVNYFLFNKSDHGSWTIKKMPSFMVKLCGPWCNRPLGPLHTQAKGRDHISVRALDCHPKVVPIVQFFIYDTFFGPLGLNLLVHL
jgi:hypothetical protein